MSREGEIQNIVMGLAQIWLRVPDMSFGELIGAISGQQGQLMIQVEREHGMASDVNLRRLPPDIEMLTDAQWAVRVADLLGEP